MTEFVITQTAYKKTAVSDIQKVQIFPGWKFRILVSVFLLIQLSVRVARKEFMYIKQVKGRHTVLTTAYKNASALMWLLKPLPSSSHSYGNPAQREGEGG